MKFGKKVVVAVDMNETSFEHMKMLRHLDFLKQSEVHFVHVSQSNSYGYGFGEVSLVYPTAADQELLEQVVQTKLNKWSQEVMPMGSQGNVTTRCLFDEKPKEKLCLYATEVNADMIVILARDKHGFFDSSFSQYVTRHSKCHVLILKQNQEK